MNYDAEIARLVDVCSTRCSRLTGKPEHRKLGAQKLLVELADAIKKLTREGTLEFYEHGRVAAPVAPLGPLFPGTHDPAPPSPAVHPPTA